MAERLIASGLLRRERGRKLFSHPGERYPAVDLYDVARPRLMLNHVLYNREEIDLTHALLAALLSAVGVEFILGHDTNRHDRHELRSLVTSLIRAMPGQLQEL